MITILSLSQSEEYQEMIEILKADDKVKEYYARMKEIGSAESEEYKELYIECLEYQSQLVDGLKRSIKIKKLLNKK